MRLMDIKYTCDVQWAPIFVNRDIMKCIKEIIHFVFKFNVFLTAFL